MKAPRERPLLVAVVPVQAEVRGGQAFSGGDCPSPEIREAAIFH